MKKGDRITSASGIEGTVIKVDSDGVVAKIHWDTGEEQSVFVKPMTPITEEASHERQESS